MRLHCLGFVITPDERYFLVNTWLTIPFLCRKSNSGDCSLENISSRNEDSDNLEKEVSNSSGSNDASGDYHVKHPMFQKGVLRTNCIDCLDRTNVAQYAYGLVALGRQLHALGFLDSPNIDLDNPLAEELMRVYETMGDTLALQYGGSAAHNKVIPLNFGVWKIFNQILDPL